MKPRAAGKHYILELYDCPPEALDNEAFIRGLVKEGARAAGTTLLQTTCHRFFPQGLTALGLLTESHLSIHTWPEAGYAAVDLFTCGDHCRPEKACEFLAQALQAGRQEIQIILRGEGTQSESSGSFARFTHCKPHCKPLAEPDLEPSGFPRGVNKMLLLEDAVKNMDKAAEKTLDMNIDAAEIARFEAMAPHWWDRKGAFKALHDINPLRLDYIRTRAGLSGKQVLDVGCGGGILSEAMAAAGAKVTGIDMSPAPLAVARLHGRQRGLAIDYRLTTCEALAETHAGHFDVVTCLEMLEHVPQPFSVIHACKHLLKPGGDLFFATVNRTVKSFLLAIVAAEYLLGLVAKGTHTFRRFIKPAELTRWSEKAGLECLDLSGLQYNPVFKTCSLGGSTAVNYLVHVRRPHADATSRPFQ